MHIAKEGLIDAMRRWTQKLDKMAAGLLDLPSDVTLDLPRMTIIGNRQLYIENHRGVQHFSDDCLRLGLSIGVLEVYGRELVIRAIFPEEMLIEGIIAGLELNGVPVGR